MSMRANPTMPRRQPVLAGLLALVSLAFGGCLSRPYQGQAMFALDGGPPASGGPAAAPVHDDVLRISDVVVASPFDSSQFMYRYADGSMRPDPYAGYIASPESLIARALVERLGRDRLFRNVVGMDLPSVQAYELVVSVASLVTVYDGSKGAAHVAGTAFVMDQVGSTPALLATLQASADVRVDGDGSAAVAAAMNAALARWIDALGAQLRDAQLPPLRDAKDRAGLLSGVRAGRATAAETSSAGAEPPAPATNE